LRLPSISLSSFRALIMRLFTSRDKRTETRYAAHHHGNSN
jgi:hypothetical protein